MVLFAGIGLCLGVVYGLRHPGMPSAQATVIIPSTAGAGASCATLSTIASQEFIAGSSIVLAKAGITNEQTKVSSSADNMLTIQVRASSGPQAERLATAAANAYKNEAAAVGMQMKNDQVKLLQSDIIDLEKTGAPKSEIGSYETDEFNVSSNVVVGAQVFPGVSFKKPSSLNVPIHGLYGLIAGLIIGCLAALWRGRRDDHRPQSPEVVDPFHGLF